MAAITTRLAQVNPQTVASGVVGTVADALTLLNATALEFSVNVKYLKVAIISRKITSSLCLPSAVASIRGLCEINKHSLNMLYQ